MQDLESLKNKIMSINDIEEMESFLNENFGSVIEYFNEKGLDKEMLKKMFTTISEESFYNLYYALVDFLDDYGLLLTIYEVDKDLATKIASITIDNNVSVIEQLLIRLHNHKANKIDTLLLIEGIIEIKRTKGHEISEEDFRKAM